MPEAVMLRQWRSENPEKVSPRGPVATRVRVGSPATAG